MIESTNPATGQTLKIFEQHDNSYIEQALSQGFQAQKEWALKSISERVQLLHKVSYFLRERKAQYSSLITLEMGKPIVEAEHEIDKCAFNCDFYAQKSSEFLADQIVESNATLSKVIFEPLGLVLAIMPWNYPFWQVIRCAVPTLAAGNGIILKHASNVPQCALALEELFRDAGAPEGLFRTLLVEGSAVQGLIENPHIAAVTLTGSTPVGKIVASQAGAFLKKQVLELGGSDPFIVLSDADLSMAAKTAVQARFQNAGQSCISAKRFLVESCVADKFSKLLCENVSRLKMGDPTQRDVTLGPMARKDLRQALHVQVERSIQQGAILLTGGRYMDGPGFFYEPTILDHVTTEMTVGYEETFGPSATIIRVQDVQEAIEISNSLNYGLGASVWSQDIQKATVLAYRIEAGAVFINGLVASDPRLPFGGIKQSGYGRELGAYGSREFTNVKTLWIGPRC